VTQIVYANAIEPRRDKRALDYGLYTLINDELNAAMYHATDVDLDEIERFLTGTDDEDKQHAPSLTVVR
jgi:hypothetical protein